MPEAWAEYISAAHGDIVDRCRASCGPAFAVHRETLSGLYKALRPQRVGCLGAGPLNDIPVAEFLAGGSEVFLVDWVPAISKYGFRSDMIREAGGELSCLACELDGPPEQYCGGYRRAAPRCAGLCDNYVPLESGKPCCGSYESGVHPHFIAGDVTRGRAEAFARKARSLVNSARTPKAAFAKAVDGLRACRTISRDLPIESGTLDLVTSSMIISQFDFEPYEYFAKLLAQRFGELLLEQEKELLPLMEKLRSEFFRIQVEAHAEELFRLVNKEHGHVFFSVELFQKFPEAEQFFVVPGIPSALETLGKRFAFVFDAIPPERALHRVAVAPGASIVQSYVLRPLAA
jgi:hypothetical protein